MNSLISTLHRAAGLSGRAARRRPVRGSSQLLSLEQRFMFDGAVADAAHAAQAHDAPAPATPPAVTVRAADPSKDQGKKEVVLVDTSVADYKTLEAGVREGVGIVEFDGSKDGLAQIAQWASTQSNYDAIHILSHGAQGVVDLGTMHLSTDSLSSTDVQQELAQLGQALTSDGDLLLYGCDVAAGSQGARLLDGLARATGADVAASTDATGAAAKGGNWTLESHVGQIETEALRIADYQGLLTQVTITGSDANYTTYQFTKDVNGVTFTFAGGDPGSGNGLGMDTSFGAEGLYAYDGSTVSGVKLTITVQSGYTFDLSGLDVGLFSGNLTIQYTDASNQTHTLGQNGVGMGSWQTLTGLNSTINDVVKIVISSDDFGDFQNFDFTDIKSIAPVATVNSATLSADTGASGDFITKTASQTITGTLSAALGSGERVEVSYDHGATWSNATSYSVGSSSWSTSTTLSGSNTFEARVTNTNGSSTAYTHTYTLDTTAPTTTFSNLSLSADTGASNTDFVTNIASQTISATLSGALGAGDVVYGSLDGGSTWTDITAKVSGTTLSWNGATLSGSNTLMLKVTDAAGNDGTVASRSYTLDTSAPSTTISSLGFSNDSGTSSGDFITNVAAQTISGTLSANLQSGETVYVSLNNGVTWSAATAAVGANTWSLSGRTLTSSGTLKVKVSDTAGNDGTVLSQAYVYDTVAPTTTFSGLALSADTGSSNSDFITKTAAQTISATLSGALSAGDVLWGSLDNGGSWTDITSKVSGTALSWNGVTLSGSGTLQLKVVDAAGNEGAVRAQAYTLDTSAPATPTITLNSGSDTGASSSDGITSDTTPTFTGTAESGSTVNIYDGATLLGSAVATGGSWSFTSTTLNDGGHTISATATDTAGNVSSASSGLAITVDATAPTVASVSVPANATYYSGDTMSFSVNFSEAVTVDTSGGTPRIAIVVGSTTRYATYVSGSGSSTLVFSYSVANGDTDSNGITIGTLAVNGSTLRDTAGNDATLTLNSVGSTAAVLVDGSQVSVTNISASTTDGSYGAGSTVTITVDFSGAVDVNTSGGTPTLALSSGGIAIYAGGSGTSTLTFSYTVGAGENSADLDYSSTSALVVNGAAITDAASHRNASVALSAPGAAGSLGANKNIVIDTTAPTITGGTLSFSADTGSSSTDLITNTPLQNISGTLTGSLSGGDSVQVSLDNGASWHTATGAGNNWSLTPQAFLNSSGTLQVRVIDAAGNIGSAASYAYVIDTVAPTTSFSNIAFSNDSGISNTDLITNSSAQTISANLSAALTSGDRLYGSLDNGATWTDITSKVSGTTLSWDGVTLAGSNTLQLRMMDAAGNYGSPTSAAYQLDNSAPTNTVATVALSNDSGTSNSDFITNVAAQTISGTLSANLASGETVYVSLDNGGSWHAATGAVGQNTWSLSGRTLAASDTLLVKVSNVAGNDGAVLSQAYTYDTTPPAAATVNPLDTMSLAPVLTGSATLAAGDSMTVTVGGATYHVTPVAGSWSLDLATAVPSSGALSLVLNSRYEVVARVTDVAGNVASDASSGELLVGTIPVAVVDNTPAPPPLPRQTQLPSLPSLGIDFALEHNDATPAASPTLVVLPVPQPNNAWLSPSNPVQALLDIGRPGDLPPAPSARGDLIGNDGILVANMPQPDLNVFSGDRISFALPDDAFSFSGSSNDLQLSTTLADGRPLPAWLHFDSRTGTFDGIPPAGFTGALQLSITARDGQGHIAVQAFKIVVGKRATGGQRAGLQPVGRPGLEAQLHMARDVHVDRMTALAHAGMARQQA